MLRIRFVILFGVLLGSALSFAAVKARPRSELRVKKAMAQPEQARRFSGEN
jgi:hypothetical protein